MEAATVAGDHFTMLRHPGVGEMAARIEAKAQGRRDRILPARDKRVFQHRS